MSNNNKSIALPQVKVLSTGKVLTEQEALAKSIEPHIVTYKYNDCEWAIALDPRLVTTEAEDAVQEIQLLLAEDSDVDAERVAQLSAEGKSQDEIAEIIKNEVSTGAKKTDYKKLMSLIKQLKHKQIEMLAPAVVAVNDPSKENYPTIEMLKAGGMLANRMIEAMLAWWNPTEAVSTAAKTPTGTAK